MSTDHFLWVSPFVDCNPYNHIILLVGPRKQKIFAHAAYIKTDSPIIGEVFLEPATGQFRTLELPDEDETVMRHYLIWSYEKKLPTSHVKSLTGGHDSDPCYSLLARLYVSAERLGNQVIQRDLIAEFIRLTTIWKKELVCPPPMDSVNTIYRGTSAESNARRLMVDLHLKFGEEKLLTPDFDMTFILDLAKAAVEMLHEVKEPYDSFFEELKAINYQ